MHGMEYVWEKFMQAVYGLTKDRPLRERIAAGWMHVITRLDDSDFDDVVRPEWVRVKTLLTRIHDSELGAVQASVNSLTDRQLEQMAVKLIDFYAWAVSYMDHALFEAVLVEPEPT